MLNYEASDFTSSLGESVQIAREALGNADGVYGSTWIVGMDRSWSNLVNSDDAKLFAFGENTTKAVL